MAAAENEKVVWASMRNIHYVYVVVPHPRAIGGFLPSFFKPLKNVANGYVCTLGSDRLGTRHGSGRQENRLCRLFNQPDQLWNAKVDAENPDYFDDEPTFSSSEIEPPIRFWAFVEKLITLMQSYGNGHVQNWPEYSKGKLDDVAFINTLLKLAGVPASRRMLGAGKGLPHQNMLDEALFSLDGRVDPGKSRIPVDPNAKNPAGIPKLLPGQKIHTVVSGDWLSKIAQRYYGDMLKYKALHDWNDNLNGNWNRKEIGPDPDVIEVGMRIIIPPFGELR